MHQLQALLPGIEPSLRRVKPADLVRMAADLEKVWERFPTLPAPPATFGLVAACLGEIALPCALIRSSCNAGNSVVSLSEGGMPFCCLPALGPPRL